METNLAYLDGLAALSDGSVVVGGDTASGERVLQQFNMVTQSEMQTVETTYRPISLAEVNLNGQQTLAVVQSSK